MQPLERNFVNLLRDVLSIISAPFESLKIVLLGLKIRKSCEISILIEMCNSEFKSAQLANQRRAKSETLLKLTTDCEQKVAQINKLRSSDSMEKALKTRKTQRIIKSSFCNSTRYVVQKLWQLAPVQPFRMHCQFRAHSLLPHKLLKTCCTCCNCLLFGVAFTISFHVFTLWQFVNLPEENFCETIRKQNAYESLVLAIARNCLLFKQTVLSCFETY